MKPIRRGAGMLLALLSLILATLAFPNAAHATESYPVATSLRTSSTISGSSCNPADVTFDWSSYLTDASKWYGAGSRSADSASFLAAKADTTNGSWGVQQYSDGSLAEVEFWWTEDPSAHLDWSVDGVSITTTTAGANIHIADVVCQNYYYGGGVSTPVVGSTGMIHSYMVGTSLPSSLGYTQRPLFIHGFGNDGMVFPTSQPEATDVAMGDSFSSGEGNGPFEGGTDIDGTDTCHRSSVAYPRLLQNDTSLNLGMTAFVACSGATTSAITGPGTYNSEPPQVDALSDSTQVVTLTIGGNDVGFTDYATACVWPIGSRCDSSSSIYATTVDKITDVLPGALKSTYEAILQDAPNAQVYVADYPYMMPVKSSTDPEESSCFYLYIGQNNWGNAQAARYIVGQIDATIATEIGKVQDESPDYASRLHYVPTNGTSSPFVGHTVCDAGSSDFQNVDQAGNNRAYVFHPNAAGHLDLKNLFSYAITGGIA
jgi:lysophospholipase L1-like esterase